MLFEIDHANRFLDHVEAVYSGLMLKLIPILALFRETVDAAIRFTERFMSDVGVRFFHEAN